MGEVSATTSIRDPGVHAPYDHALSLLRRNAGGPHGLSESHGPAYGFRSQVTGVSGLHSATALDSLLRQFAPANAVQYRPRAPRPPHPLANGSRLPYSPPSCLHVP